MKTSKKHPPKFAENFLAWIIKPSLREEVLGDLKEQFDINLENQSAFRAKCNYCYQTIHYLRPFALRNNIFSNLKPFFMFRHHIKISLRSFQRNFSTFFGIIFWMTVLRRCIS